MDELYQECFGHCRNDRDCRECDFFASCVCISETEPQMERHFGMVSFEALEGWSQLAAAPGFTPGEEEAEEEISEPIPPELAPLAEFCRFLFTLDDYTLGILAEIIVPDASLPGGCTAAALARLHRCSRQAMHRKMLASVRRYPELAGVFQLALRKIGRSRAQFRRREQRHA